MTTLLIKRKSLDKNINFLLHDLNKVIDSHVENNFDKDYNINLFGDVMEFNDCNSLIFFECTKKNKKIWVLNKDYAIKSNIISFITIEDLATVHNGHQDSGIILYFSKEFDQDADLKIFKRVLSNALSLDKKLIKESVKESDKESLDIDGDDVCEKDKNEAKVQEKIKKNKIKERLISFYYKDGNIHFRHYLSNGLKEIGPRIEFQVEKVLSLNKKEGEKRNEEEIKIKEEIKDEEEIKNGTKNIKE